MRRATHDFPFDSSRRKCTVHNATTPDTLLTSDLCFSYVFFFFLLRTGTPGLINIIVFFSLSLFVLSERGKKKKKRRSGVRWLNTGRVKSYITTIIITHRINVIRVPIILHACHDNDCALYCYYYFIMAGHYRNVHANRVKTILYPHHGYGIRFDVTPWRDATTTVKQKK